MLDYPQISGNPTGMIFIVEVIVHIFCISQIALGQVEMATVHIDCAQITERLEHVSATLFENYLSHG